MEDPKSEDAEKMEDVRNPQRGLEEPSQWGPISGPHPQTEHADEVELMIPDDVDDTAHTQIHEGEWER